MVSTPEQNREANKRYRTKNKQSIKDREKQRRPRRTNYMKMYQRRRRLMKPFVGVDGEGRNLDNGYHAYFMLRAGDRVLWNKPMDKRLRTNDMLEFLSSLDPDKEYVSYFFDYDVAKILEDLTWSKLDKLVHREKRKRNKGGYFPVDWGKYQIEYFPKKELKVKKEGGQWITISDTGTFFQSAFIKTLNLWEIGTPEQREQIAEGKELRSEFKVIDNEYIDKYNELECILLADLMTQFRDICIELGYVPRKWQGPGQLAEAMLAKHGIPKNSELDIFTCGGELGDVEYGVGAFGRYAYYGGWFEVPMVGYTPVPCIQWDLNSAYPSALQHVPCLVHGTWRRVTERRQLDDEELSICFGDFRWDRDSKRPLLGGLPIRRDNGSIHHPLNGKGWYWSMEIRSAVHQEFTCYDSWVYEKHCDCKPFEFLEGLYKFRKSIGKTAKGIVLKLIMNSIYGKLVQSIGNPAYSNPIWGSFITAWTRTAMAWTIHSLPACRVKSTMVPCGSDVYMVATDAVITKDYPGLDECLDVGSGLGQFTKETHENGLFIIQPGLYFDPVGDNEKTFYKTRGVPKAKVIEYRQAFLDGYARLCGSRNVSKGDVHLPFTLFLGIKQALLRKNMKLMGQFLEYKDPDTGQPGRRTSFEWTTKRRPEPLPPTEMMDYGDEQIPARIWTLPYWGREDDEGRDCSTGMIVQTVPYDRDIGGLVRNEAYRMEFDGQPDWVATQ